MRILLVEDDAMVGAAERKGLADAGFAVDWVRDGHSASLAIANGVYDLIVLDLGLPRKDGMSLLAELRRSGNRLPVLIVTARDAVQDRVLGLNAGADDYLLKPFDLDELIARMHALLRRAGGNASPVLTVGRISLDPIARQVTQDGREVELSSREFAILEALMRKPDGVMSRAELEEAVYDWDSSIGSNAIEVHLHKLRRKLGSDAIRNIRGVGYRVSGGQGS
jgi:two-component system, OmpR family, response regulator QseB